MSLSHTPASSDFAHRMCGYIVPYVPRWISPNHLTLANHLVNWLLLLSAIGASHVFTHQPHPIIRGLLCIACGIFNLSAMLLDTLDGMHARHSKQTSKLGEVLDHYFDALHVPIVCCACSLTLGIPDWLHYTNLALYVAHYNQELVIYYHQGRFVNTSGAFGQIMCSFLHIALGIGAFFMSAKPYSQFADGLAYMMGFVSLAIILHHCWSFLYEMHSWEEHRDNAYTSTLAMICVGLALSDCMTRLGCTLLLCALSYRDSGSYVLHSCLQTRYMGLDRAIPFWIFSIFASNILFPTVPLMALSPWHFDSFKFITFQHAIPFFAFAHLVSRAVCTLLDNVSGLKRLDLAVASLKAQ